MFYRLIDVVVAGGSTNYCYLTHNYHFLVRSLRLHSRASQHDCNFFIGFIFFALFNAADSTLERCHCGLIRNTLQFEFTVDKNRQQSQSLKFNTGHFWQQHNTGTILSVVNVLELVKKSQICKCTLLCEANVKTWWSR